MTKCPKRRRKERPIGMGVGHDMPERKRAYKKRQKKNEAARKTDKT